MKKPASLLLMEKEMSEGDKNLKMKLLFSEDSTINKSNEALWSKDGFFNDQRSDLTIGKANFPENTLFYVNQARVSTVKAGEQAIYMLNVVLAQILPYANIPDDIEKYKLKDDEVFLTYPVYDRDTSKFKGTETRVALIIVRGDENECFLSYGYDPDKSKQLYSSFKQEIPNVFSSTTFKKFNDFLLSTDKGEFSTLFYYLPSTTDRKEKINQFKSNVQLFPLTVEYEDFTNFNKGKRQFFPQHLDSADTELRSVARETVVNYMKQVGNFSNSNLKRNAKSLALTDKVFDAVVPQETDFSARFKKTYWLNELDREGRKHRAMLDKTV